MTDNSDNDNVVNIAEVVSNGNNSVQSIVDIFEQCLNDAKAGKIQAVAIATVTNENHITSEWYRNDSKTSYLASALTLLHHRFYTEFNRGFSSDE